MPTFYLVEPCDVVAREVLAGAASGPFNDSGVGLTRGTVAGQTVAGHTVDRYGVELGLGDEVFARARAASGAFVMYPAPWTRVVTLGPIAEGTIFGACIHHLGFWSLNPCRIIEVSDEPEVFGFAFGTLRGHAEAGEERFSAVQERDGRVHYRVEAISRPAHLLARLGALYARRLQLRFQRESCAAMQRAVRDGSQQHREQLAWNWRRSQ